MKIRYFVILAVLLTVFLGFSGTAKALTVGELQVQIKALMTQIAQLQEQLKQQQNQGTGAWCYNFNKNIAIGGAHMGNIGGPGVLSDDLQALIDVLRKENILTSDYASPISYDESMASLVSELQEKYADEILKPAGLRKGTGYVGPSTRKKLNALYGCSPVAKPVICSQDAKQCSDGSYVSRVAPSCEFSSCPTTTQTIINYILPNQASIGQAIQVDGSNLCGFESDKNLWIENSSGLKGIIYGSSDSTCNKIKFKLADKYCKTDESYRGLPCASYLNIVSGTYNIYANTPGGTSNKVSFAVTSSTQPSITITSSMDGPFNTGSSIPLYFTTSGLAGKIINSISLSNLDTNTGYGLASIIIERDGAQNVNELIPNIVPAGNRYRLYMHADICDREEPACWAETQSGIFRIINTTTQPSPGSISTIDLVSPSIGNQLGQGSNVAITWTGGQYSDGTRPAVDISLYSADCSDLACVRASRKTIALVANVNNSYSWQVGKVVESVNFVAPGNYFIEVCAGGNGDLTKELACSASNNIVFRITESLQPSITVTSPNGGEQWARGSTQNITWNPVGLSSTSKVAITLTNSGANPTILATNIPSNNGTYSWTVPNTLLIGSQYKIQVYEIGTSYSVTDYGDNYFSIVMP